MEEPDEFSAAENTHAAFLNGLVDQALEVLSEHFDSIQVVGTFLDDGQMTHCLTRGTGNWYSRVGAVREFLDRDQAQTTAHAIGQVMPGNEEEG